MLGLLRSLKQSFNFIGFFIILVTFLDAKTVKAQDPKFNMLLFSIGQMVFDPGVSINSMENLDDYVLLTGSAPSKIVAYRLAVMLLHSRLLNEYRFVDVVPSWEKSTFSFRLIKQPPKVKKDLSVLIEEPKIREKLKNDLTLSGDCSMEKAQIQLSGDLFGTTSCKNGKWKFSLPIANLKLPIIGVQVSIGLKPNDAQDFRSYLLPHP